MGAASAGHGHLTLSGTLPPYAGGVLGCGWAPHLEGCVVARGTPREGAVARCPALGRPRSYDRRMSANGPWTCESCGKPIDDPEDGLVVWSGSGPVWSSSFRIVHGSTLDRPAGCPLRGEWSGDSRMVALTTLLDDDATS